MVDGWMTWLLVAFGIIVAVAGVYAYFRLISATSADEQTSKEEERHQAAEREERLFTDRKEG